MAQASLIGIVDDDESIRIAVDALLRSAGLSSIGFASAEEFLESKDAAAIRCLILDWSMPGIDGHELQRRLVTAGDATPMIFLTAHGNESRRAQALSSGAIAFLPKPVDANVLLSAVNEALKR